MLPSDAIKIAFFSRGDKPSISSIRILFTITVKVPLEIYGFMLFYLSI